MDRRRAIAALALLGGDVAWHPVWAQQTKVWRVGFLGARSRSTPSHPDPHYDAFVQGMRQLGYFEGKNLIIEWRFADGRYDLLPSLATDLVKISVDVIVSQGTPGTKAAQAATRSIPIVFPAINDPVGNGIVPNLAKPGGNTTGFTDNNAELALKQFQLLKTLTPSLSRVAFLLNPGNPAHPAVLSKLQAMTPRPGVQLVSFRADSLANIERAFSALGKERVDALMIPADGFLNGHVRQIAELAVKNRLPTIFVDRGAVDAGGLMSYGANLVEQYRHAATYVDKILKGAKAGDLPVEQPTKFELVINHKTAKALGLTIPKELLLRADEVIE